MREYKGVRGSMDSVPNIEVNIDTVYVRSNVVAIDEEGFKGWEYDEIQYNKDNYIELISEKNIEMEKELADAWYDNIIREIDIKDNQEEIADLWFEAIKGGV